MTPADVARSIRGVRAPNVGTSFCSRSCPGNRRGCRGTNALRVGESAAPLSSNPATTSATSVVPYRAEGPISRANSPSGPLGGAVPDLAQVLGSWDDDDG